ncbi:Glutaredoxin-related protein [Phaffia rhodozyma]|uniref:Glutaredoxin-related protein n=1 Tax=Phaffia rhodozyma TaxID=264483 RepID=A0A0F7SM71_PHARH|nr:Glutaredoxin-related protein [Phaffia rhodozyma]
MSSSQNLIDVTSPDHFKDLLSADLNRVSLLNFWAPWADVCKEMNEVVKSLAENYPQVLVLNIEAEEQPDISESFDIEAVPTFLLLRGHSLLSRHSGSVAPALTAALSTHASSSPSAPLSTTTVSPQAPQSLDEKLTMLMNRSPVMLFMKGNPDAPQCGFSRQATAVLRGEGVEFGWFDIFSDNEVREGMKKKNDWPTFPQIIVKGELIGGLDILKEMVASGEFQELIEGI